MRSDPRVDALEASEERAQEQKKERDVGLSSNCENPPLEVPFPEPVNYVDYDNSFKFIGKSCGPHRSSTG